MRGNGRNTTILDQYLYEFPASNSNAEPHLLVKCIHGVLASIPPSTQSFCSRASSVACLARAYLRDDGRCAVWSFARGETALVRRILDAGGGGEGGKSGRVLLVTL